jgi:hypothetical protein
LSEVIYSLSWYKKRGAQALKTITADTISGLTLLSSPRPIVYVLTDFSVHSAEAAATTAIQGVPVKEVTPSPLPLSLTHELCHLQENGDSSSKREFSFSVSLSGSGSGAEKDIVLRADSLERLVHWINILTEAASLIYDNLQGCWVKGDRVSKPQQANPKYILRAATSPPAATAAASSSDSPASAAVESDRHVSLSLSLSSHLLLS